MIAHAARVEDPLLTWTYVYVAVLLALAALVLVPAILRERRERRQEPPPTPVRRPRRKSKVVDGYTYPSDTVRAIFRDDEEKR